MSLKKVPIVIANWKMNGLLLESMQKFKQIRKNILESLIGCEVVICPPYTLLRDLAEKVPGTGVKLGGQDCHFQADGSYTGDISAAMLRDMTCDYVIVGHSERRMGHNETSGIIQKKAMVAHKSNLITVICVGETLYEKENGLDKIMVREQLLNSIPKCSNETNTLIAYEPVWAIGTDKIPSEEDIASMHRHIAEVISKEMPQFKSVPRIIYGGSVTAKNSPDILGIKEVNGLLLGRASLDVNEFWQIILDASK